MFVTDFLALLVGFDCDLSLPVWVYLDMGFNVWFEVSLGWFKLWVWRYVCWVCVVGLEWVIWVCVFSGFDCYFGF